MTHTRHTKPHRLQWDDAAWLVLTMVASVLLVSVGVSAQTSKPDEGKVARVQLTGKLRELPALPKPAYSWPWPWDLISATEPPLSEVAQELTRVCRSNSVRWSVGHSSNAMRIATALRWQPETLVLVLSPYHTNGKTFAFAKNDADKWTEATFGYLGQLVNDCEKLAPLLTGQPCVLLLDHELWSDDSSNSVVGCKLSLVQQVLEKHLTCEINWYNWGQRRGERWASPVATDVVASANAGCSVYYWPGSAENQLRLRATAAYWATQGKRIVPWVALGQYFVPQKGKRAGRVWQRSPEVAPGEVWRWGARLMADKRVSAIVFYPRVLAPKSSTWVQDFLLFCHGAHGMIDEGASERGPPDKGD